MRSGTNAPLYTTTFSNGTTAREEDDARHEARLAQALGIDRSRRILAFDDPRATEKEAFRFIDASRHAKTKWENNAWVMPISSGKRVSYFILEGTVH